MGLSFHCPQCSQAVPALPTQMGQQMTCPACKAQFRLSPMLLGGNGQSGAAAKSAPLAAVAAPAPPHPAPPASAAPPVATVVKAPLPPRTAVPPVAPVRPPVAASAYASPPPLASPAGLAAPPRAPAPAPPALPPAQQRSAPNVARFITAASQDSTVQLTAEGKLPELSLAEASAKKAKSSDSNASPLVLGLALVGSTLVSILLVVADFSGTADPTSQTEARQKIEQFYVSQSGPHLPYQQLLRESQRAYWQGDYKAERDLYRQVLALLRSESKDPYAGVTGTKSGDEELERLLAILLDTEGR